MSLIVHVLATRPDAVAIAPVYAALERHGVVRQLLLHAAGNTEPDLVEETLEDLGLPVPECRLGITGREHAAQTAEALAASARLLAELQPAAVIVAGAADPALGCALATVKLGIPVARLEAGLRVHDWSVPDEINRVLLDRMADTLFATSQDALVNLQDEGIRGGRVYLAGSTVVGAIRRVRPHAEARGAWRPIGLERGRYVLVTLDHPANVDDDERLARIVEVLASVARRTRVVFPLHPRTRNRLTQMGDAHRLLAAGVLCVPPLRYLDFLSLQCGAASVVTDSGAVQEEATALGVRCFTLRPATERTVTVTHGTNVLVDGDPRDLADTRLLEAPRVPAIIPLWDGSAGERIAEALVGSYALVRAAAS